MYEEIMRFFEKIKHKNIKVNQLGFIELEFYINKAKYEIKQDILKVKNEVEIKIAINMNQIYKIEKADNYILIYLDNDTQLRFSIL